MLPIVHQKQNKAMFWRYIVLFVGISYLTPAFAQTAVETVSAQDMIRNIAGQIPNLMRFLTALAYVLGFYFIFYGILKLKQYGESRTMMSQQHQLKEPLMFFIAGTLLIYLPSSVNVGLSTFWSNPTPYEWPVQEDEWGQLYSSMFMIIQLIGTIAFIRGIVMLTRLAGHGGHNASFGRAITHIVAGLFCINIYQFIQVVFATLGISFEP